MGLRTRLVAALVLVALTTLTVGGIGIQRMSVLSDEATQLHGVGVGVGVGVGSVIAEINDHQASIAAAVEQQTATTNEMNRNVVEAAGGSRSIADSASGPAANAQATHAQVADLERAAAGYVV